jgi:hypothetical protein
MIHAHTYPKLQVPFVGTRQLCCMHWTAPTALKVLTQLAVCLTPSKTLPSLNFKEGTNQPMRPRVKRCTASAPSTEAERLRRHVPHLSLTHTHRRCHGWKQPNLHHHKKRYGRQTCNIHCPSMTRLSYYNAACQRPGTLTRAEAADSSCLCDMTAADFSGLKHERHTASHPRETRTNSNGVNRRCCQDSLH